MAQPEYSSSLRRTHSDWTDLKPLCSIVLVCTPDFSFGAMMLTVWSPRAKRDSLSSYHLRQNSCPDSHRSSIHSEAMSACRERSSPQSRLLGILYRSMNGFRRTQCLTDPPCRSSDRRYEWCRRLSTGSCGLCKVVRGGSIFDLLQQSHLQCHTLP